MSEIFLSYSSVDRPAAARIEAALSARGHDVFWDQEVPPGSDWDTWIRAKLEAAKVAVVLWSRASIKSPNVRHEAMVARDAGKLVPAMIEPLAAGDFPMGLYLVQGVQMDDWRNANSAGLARLVAEIESRLGHPAPAAAPPPQPNKNGNPLPLIIGACAVIAIASAGVFWMLQQDPGRNQIQAAGAEAPLASPTASTSLLASATAAENACAQARLDWASVEASSDIAVLETFLVATPDACTVQRAQAEARIRTVREEKQLQEDAEAEARKAAAFKASGGDFLGLWEEHQKRDRASAGCWRWYRISRDSSGLLLQFGNDQNVSEGQSRDVSIQGKDNPILAFPDGWTFRLESGFMNHYSTDNTRHACRWVRR